MWNRSESKMFCCHCVQVESSLCVYQHMRDKKAPKYSDNVGYLVSAIFYLGTHVYWWGRTCKNMAKELNLDSERLQQVFDGFPGIFRRSHRVSSEGPPITRSRHATRNTKQRRAKSLRACPT
jgi:hypothetical protein